MGDCCDKAKSKDQSHEAEMARLCCATNCTTSVPTSSVASFNLAPINFTVTGSIAEQIAALFSNEKAAPVISSHYSRGVVTRTIQPKYVQHNSFLI